MFHRKTVFVVGAGASAEIGLPLGGELATIIQKKMDVRYEQFNKPVGAGDHDLFVQITKNFANNAEGYQKASWLIRDGIQLARSIDDFLDMHRDDALVVEYGKAAIVKSVLEAEHKHATKFKDINGMPAFSPGHFAGTWYAKLMQMLGPGVSKANLKTLFNNVSFIVFNYDRCIEYFLLNAVQKLYGIAAGPAEEIVGKLAIIHPYEVIDRSIPFGSVRANHTSLAAGIKTYTEQVNDPKMNQEIHAQLQLAQTIVFLGFAYHDQNILLLEPPQKLKTDKTFYGSAFGLSDSDVRVVERQVLAWAEPRMASIDLENKLKCSDLFDHYTKSLTARN